MKRNKIFPVLLTTLLFSISDQNKQVKNVENITHHLPLMGLLNNSTGITVGDLEDEGDYIISVFEHNLIYEYYFE